MMSRRGLLGFILGGTGALVPLPVLAKETKDVADWQDRLTPDEIRAMRRRGGMLHEALRAHFDEDTYLDWLHTLEFEGVSGETITLSTPFKFLKTWMENHYQDDLVVCCRRVFKEVEKVDIIVRKPRYHGGRRYYVYNEEGYLDSDWSKPELAIRRLENVKGGRVIGRQTYDEMGLTPEEM